MKSGGHVLAIGLNQAEANSFLPVVVRTKDAEHIAAYFPPFGEASLLAGVSPADVQNRDPRQLPMLTGGATIYGDGVLAETGKVVFCQLVPWQFDQSPEHFNQRRTFQRTSYAVSRLLGNLDAASITPLLARFGKPAETSEEPSVVRNGDFSAGANDNASATEWEFGAEPKGASCTRVKLSGSPGDWAQLIAVPPVANQASAPQIMLAQHDVPIQGGTWYRLSFRSRAEDLASREIMWTVQNTITWQPLFDYQNFKLEPRWQTNTCLVRARDTLAKGSKFQIWFNGTGKLWLADVRLQPVPDPTVGRWLEGLYLTRPVTWDDPYRFFGW